MKHTVDLTDHELALIREVLARHSSIAGAIVFGSRAMGTARPESDIDLALEGIDDPLEAQAIANELEELPLPYRFDVTALDAVRIPSLREHIKRVGIRISA